MKKLLIILLAFISINIFGQVNYTIQDSVRVSTECDNDFSPVIQFPRDVPTNGIFKNNSITYCNPASYIVMLGEDGPLINDNHLDGAVVSGNYLRWTGYDYHPEGVMHGLMAGYQINQHYKWNYFDRVGYCVVYKSGGDGAESMTNTSGGTYYNIIKNTKRLGIKGVNGTRVYNNTFYTNMAGLNEYPFIKLVPNYADVGDPYCPTMGTKIKNNIFYATGPQKFFEIEDTATSFIDFECDYNIYYVEGGDTDDIQFQLNVGIWITWTEWRALGFDAHSQVIDPNFIDTINFAPTARLDYGTDLGASYNEGLAVNAIWGSGDPATATQNGDWQVGATLWETSSTAYYVSTTGDDDDPGTITEPWATWSKAFNTAVAGDTVYFRGGTYPIEVSSGLGIQYDTDNHNGTAGNWVCYFNYPGETPILDCDAVVNTGFNVAIVLNDAEYIHFKGLHIINVNEANDPPNGGICYGIYTERNFHVKFENIVLHDIGGKAMNHGTSYYTEVINCDAYDCNDQYSHAPGGWATGFANENSASDDCYTYYYGCRAWNCSDQGFSTGGDRGTVIYEKCWAYDNGLNTDGEGFNFKLGYMNINPSANDPHVIMKNCIGAYGRYGGMTTNDQGYYGQFLYVYNNFFYHNGNYGVFVLNPADNDLRRTFRNNISYDSPAEYVINPYTASNNSWDSEVTVTADDFVSLDYSQMKASRKADNSLPDITFGTLVEGSDLIDAGLDVGLDFNGTAPDLGWDEFGDEPPEPSVFKFKFHNGHWMISKRGKFLK